MEWDHANSPYRTDQVPIDYHFFGKLEEYCHGTSFEEDNSLVNASGSGAGSDFYHAGIQALFQGSVRQ